jgi:hypothetical protein
VTGEDLHRTLVTAMDELKRPPESSLRRWENISIGEKKVFDRAAELLTE